MWGSELELGATLLYDLSYHYVADIIGSPYAVTNYTCNTQLGNSDNDIMTLRQKLNSMGLLLMLDYVPNHTAVDCAWAVSEMDYYVRAPQGETTTLVHNIRGEKEAHPSIFY